MTTSGKIGVKGLKSTGNELTLEPGSLTDTTGMVLPSQGVIRTARGLTGSSYIDNDSTDANSNRPKELHQWGSHLLVNYTGNGGYKLSSFSNYATSPTYANVGSYAPPDPTVMRMKFAELAKSLFWTTDAGLYLLDSITGTARAAGLRAPAIFMSDGVAAYTQLSGNPSATGSWLAKNQAVAYRAVYGRKDANNRIVLSAASGRVVVINPNDVTVAIGNLVRNANVVTATVSAHKYRVGDIVDLTVSGGDVGNFDITNNVVTSVTATTIVWAETAGNYTNVASVTISSGTKSVQVAVGENGADFVAGDFVQLYRTDESAGEAIDPGDEMFLCYERLITSADASAGYVTITDTTPSDFLGDPLDSNDNSGEGPLGVNEQPPLCRDLCAWDGKLWGFHTTDRHRLRLRLLGTGSPHGLQSGDLVAINTRVFEAGANFVLYTQYLPSENVARTTYDMGTFLTSSLIGIVASQMFDGDTGLGEVMLEQTTLASTMADTGGAISAIYAATSRASAFADPLAAIKAITSANTSRTGSTVTVRCVGHGFSQGQVIMISRAVTGAADANFTLGLKTVASVVDVDNFTYTESGSAVTLTGATRYAYATTYKSDDNKQPVRFCRPGIPEGWPLPNTIDGLPDGAEVLRGMPTPDGGELLVCLKNGDTYAIGGQYPYNVRRVDGTAPLVLADTLKEHAGRLYGITTQGVCTLGSNGVGLVGLDVDDDVRTIVAGILAGDAAVSVPFAMSYESERQIRFNVPAVTAATGAVAASNSRSYALHSLRNEFTKQSATHACALVFRGADLMVAGQVSSNRLLLERKTLGSNGLDFAGQSLALVVNGNQSSVSTITVDAGVLFPSLYVDYAAEIGGAYYRITANGSTSITIDGTVTVADNDAITIYAYLSTSLAFAVESAGVPGIEKQFRELQLHFGVRLFKTLTVGFTSELSSSSASVTVTASDFAYGTPSTNPSTFRIEVPAEMKQAALLKVSLQMTGAFWYFNLLGYSVSYEPISEKTGR